MATLKLQDVHRALLAKGAERDETHHHMFRRRVDGKVRALTRTSHSETEIGRPRAALMARQCGLTTAQFLALVDCTFSSADWDGVLRTKH